MKYFHNYAKFRKNVNTIWEIQYLHGSIARSFQDKSIEVVHHFNALFQESICCPIQGVLEVVEKFPRLITKDMNKALFEDFSKSELLATLSSM
jgi:hypothetical protein